jgi:hypothetical protein
MDPREFHLLAMAFSSDPAGEHRLASLINAAVKMHDLARDAAAKASQEPASSRREVGSMETPASDPTRCTGTPGPGKRIMTDEAITEAFMADDVRRDLEELR